MPFELSAAAQSPVFDKDELEIIDIASRKFSSTQERNEIAGKLFDEINSLPADRRSQMLQHMEEKLNPDDPLDRVNKELSIIPLGVSCVHNADKLVLAATVNGYEMQFKVPTGLPAPFNKEVEANRLIEITRQNTGNPRFHDSGPKNNTEQKALSLALEAELSKLTAPQSATLIRYMLEKYSATDNLDKLRREQAGIPLGVEAWREKDGRISQARINGLLVNLKA